MEIIEKTSLHLEVEPLKQAFGFKGGALTELWQVTCRIVSDAGRRGTGLGVQSVLWSDSGVFGRYGQQEGNRLMLAVTEYALECLRGRTMTSPPEMITQLIPEVMEYAKKLTGEEKLRTTFVLNALTPVDWALWQLYADQKDCHCLPKLAAEFTTRLDQRQPCLGNIPLISYDTAENQITELADKGRFLFKIKIGSNPGGRNCPEEMLAWDLQRLAQIHRLLGERSTPWTECGHPVYYLDANGRYDTMERLERFLDGADQCGALSRIVLLEEPFAEDQLQSVRGLPITVAADESAHSARDACELMEEYGYGAIALKPVAKTLSVSLDILEEAGKRGGSLFLRGSDGESFHGGVQ
ncbi:MAG: mandelate racemase/muconate lactonizing enzyme family protein [Lachnospiraceae bacterium]|nr:mandelate racemase/muconate lactonizing enzyme family protein [Lachnospiraceae bacterium]